MKEIGNAKVDKVEGKGLSTNDYTTTEKTKLEGIEAGANKTTVDEDLNTSSRNPVQNQAVAKEFATKAPLVSPAFTGMPTAPTPTSGNSSTQVATTAFVAAAVAAAVGGVTEMKFSKVDALPATGQNGYIYLVPNGDTGNNSYDEYVWLGDTFEHLGKKTIDLTNYVTFDDIEPIPTTELEAMFA